MAGVNTEAAKADLALAIELVLEYLPDKAQEVMPCVGDRRHSPSR